MPAVIAKEPNHFSMSFQCEILPVFWMTFDITVCCQVPPSDSAIFLFITNFFVDLNLNKNGFSFLYNLHMKMKEKQ